MRATRHLYPEVVRGWNLSLFVGAKDARRKVPAPNAAGVVLLCAVLFGFVAQAPSAWAQSASTVGQWSSVMTWPYIATHAQVLPTGKVLWWPPFADGDNPTLWDPATNTNTAAPRVGANIFCSGFAFLPNGQLLVAGGHVDMFYGAAQCLHV